jgi:hypothetical protein
MTGNDAEKLPSDKELDELVGSAPFSGECSVLVLAFCKPSRTYKEPQESRDFD